MSRGAEAIAYLDHAATSAVRPDAVVEAVAAHLRYVGATPGRGGHRLAVEAGRTALRCRQAIARLLGLRGDAARVTFMLNATHAINTALSGVLEPGDVVVVTAFDHNAVLRPVQRLARRRGVIVRQVEGDASGALDEAGFARAADGARLVCLNAVSNVLGTRLPVRRLASIAHDAGALVLVDAAQAAGHVPITPARDGADLVAASGHKGLLGPQGTGLLWVREGIDVQPLLAGGTGGDSLDPDMPSAYPDHLEAGTQNAPGIAGLLAGVEYVLREGVGTMHSRISGLKAVLRAGLETIAGVRVLSPAAPDGAGIVTMVADGVDPSTLALRLDREFGVLTRPGLHCAPGVHRLLGTTEQGALRLSLGWCSSASDVQRAIEGVARMVAPVIVPSSAQ